ncbi:MAG: succinyl-diaminopimelate desuccinylase [Acidothermaceae bacterium]
MTTELPSSTVLLDLSRDAAELTAVLVDVPSVSGDEKILADAVETALRGLAHLDIERDGNVVLARTDLGRAHRVVLAGHLDTVPIADNVPSRLDGETLWGCGTSDMKSGVAVMLRVAALLPSPAHDLTLVFYDCEEVEAERNGLGRLAGTRPEALRGDLAILLEGTNGGIEAGCQGTLRAEISVDGVRAHSARSWLGVNAIHRAAEVLRRLDTYVAREADIDGCVYREGLNAVGIAGGVAGNVLPDSCVVTVNFRFAPDRTVETAFEHVRSVFEGYSVALVDAAPGALPGLAAPAAAEFVRAVGATPVAKYGWTDVARFAELGIPAVNFGPGDPNLAHKRDENVNVATIRQCENALLAYLSG